jgi:hypothetical protein
LGAQHAFGLLEVLAGGRLADAVGLGAPADAAGVRDVAEELELIESHKNTLS